MPIRPRLEMDPRPLIISLGNIFFKKDGRLDARTIKAASKKLTFLVTRGFQVLAIVGPGLLGTKYVDIAKRFTKNTAELDQIQITASRINARLLIESLRNLGVSTSVEPLTGMEQIAEFVGRIGRMQFVGVSSKEARHSSVGVAGIIWAGMTSDACATRIARRLRGQLFLISSARAIKKLSK